MLRFVHKRALVWWVGLVVALPLPAQAHPRHAPELHLTFPAVAGARFADDYAALRGAGRAHRGTDVFAPAGSPIFAAVGGTVSWAPGRHPSAGYALHVRGADGRTYAYYHLGPDGGPRERAYAPGVHEGAAVARGQVIGYLGDSGSAVGTAPHLHFEIHQDGVVDPYGTNRLNPYPSLVAAVARGDVGARTATPVSRAGRAGALRLGDRGPDVADWQRRLTAAGTSPGPADGVFGPGTHAATRAFQQARGLAVDGVVGARTSAAMDAALSPPLLRLGDRGPAVADWQRLLARAGHVAVRPDGIYGRTTEQATKALQTAHGLRPDGVVGPRTRAATVGR